MAESNEFNEVGGDDMRDTYLKLPIYEIILSMCTELLLNELELMAFTIVV